MKKISAIAAVFVTALVATAVPAHADQYWNEFNVEGVPEWLTSPVVATVVHSGPDEVCGMSTDKQTLTAAPWSFAISPDESKGWYGGRSYVDVQVNYCNGQTDETYITFDVPFSIDGNVISDSGRYGLNGGVTVRNDMEVGATAVVTSKTGKEIASVRVEPGQAVTLEVPASKTTQTYTLTLTGDNGVVVTKPVIRAHGWTTIMGGATIAPCSIVTWTYDPKSQPKTAKKAKADVAGGLDRLAKETGLTFVEVPNSERAQIRYLWKKMGKNGPAATGSTDGSVRLNINNWWTNNDKGAGFSPFKPYSKGNYRYARGPAGRGWLMIHETMHTLGFGHDDNDRKSIMAPVNDGQGKFTKDDLDGLHALYRNACAA